MQDISVESVRGEMKVPPELKDAYSRIVKAGLKLMFDPSTRDQTIAFMDGEGNFPQKLGEGIAAVMAMLFRESNQTMPPQLIVPAGIELLVHAAEVAEKGGEQVDAQVVAEAMGVYVEAVMKQFGVDPAQMQGMVSGMDSGLAAPTEGSPQ
jgi:hypothetical protein